MQLTPFMKSSNAKAPGTVASWQTGGSIVTVPSEQVACPTGSSMSPSLQLTAHCSPLFNPISHLSLGNEKTLSSTVIAMVIIFALQTSSCATHTVSWSVPLARHVSPALHSNDLLSDKHTSLSPLTDAPLGTTLAGATQILLAALVLVLEVPVVLHTWPSSHVALPLAALHNCF
jgi:hypothetical protein